ICLIMCGICGFNHDDKALLKKMCEIIMHRGPDDVGYFNDNKVSIGMRRLSIIDLITGHQPQHNENNDIWIVFNGEIYNYKELQNNLESKNHHFYTKSDTEIIVHAYEEWGEKCLTYFRGAFAFCIYDSRKNILFLARDRIGLKPLYYYFDGNTFIFASEIKSILCHNVAKILNLNAFNFYLSLGYVPTNETLFKRINKVLPSSYLIFNLNDKNLEINKYYSVDFNIINNISEKFLAKELRELLEDSIKIRLVSDVPLGAFLSGGLDSSTIVALMSNYLEKPVKTFSIRFEEGAPINESKYAEIVANYFNTDHKEILLKSDSCQLIPSLIWHLDDLIADPAILPVYILSIFARKNVKVILTGDGSDELFAGYSVYYKSRMPYLRLLPHFSIILIKKYYKYIYSHKLRAFLSFLKKKEEDRYYRSLITFLDEEKSFFIPFEFEKVENYIIDTNQKTLDFINKQISWDLNNQLPNQYNMKTDKMSMAASLEARIPFLDHKIVSWASAIPSYLKLKGSIEKYILRLAVKDLLPTTILNRKKVGFSTPINLWLKTSLKETSDNYLLNLAKRKNLINSNYVNKIRKNRLNKIFTHQVWNLFMFEIWYETFMENNSLKPIKF
ncbi:MAG: asparagine synthase (glutamine-hydrolyzing), partial [Candidatus Odinarchaeota archaeon]